jgi:hypothetical protein
MSGLKYWFPAYDECLYYHPITQEVILCTDRFWCYKVEWSMVYKHYKICMGWNPKNYGFILIGKL